MASYAFVTLLTSDSYLPGVLTAVHSLLDVEGVRPQTPFETVCLVTPGSVGQEAIHALNKTFDQVVGVGEITSASLDNLDLLGRRDLAASLTKLHLFRLTQYSKVIFLDADTLVLRPISHLFSLTAPFSAAPDSGWPDAFNSGFMVATPSDATFEGLMTMMSERGSWDGGDQGLLNDFFPDWHRLSFTYNVTPSAYYTYAPAYKRHGSDVNVLHFIGTRKPWHRQTRDTYVSDAATSDYHGLVNKWFDVYEHHFGTTSTVLVASRVVKPPGSFKSTYSELRPHTPSPPRTPLPAPTAIRPAAPVASWDPSRSSPPLIGAHQMAIPITEHYENAWDSRSSPTGAFIPPSSYAPPPKETHEWYRDVMGSAPPDRSLVKNVFPWEKNAPRRQFPKEASPPPAAEPTPPPPAPAATFVPAHERTFVNAWDNVPGIDRYAASLAKATGKKVEKVGVHDGGDDLGGRTSSLSEPTKSDASSRDGDDEDDSDSASSDGTPRIQVKFKKPKDGFELTPAPTTSSPSGSNVSSTPSSPTKTRKHAPLPSPRLREDLPPFSSPTSSSSSKRSATLSPTSPGPRFPTSATSPRLAAQAARNHAAARLTGTGDGPPVLRATRVFSPDTDTTVVKEQGLAALQRFVENMEAVETGRAAGGGGPAPNGRGAGGPAAAMGGPGGGGRGTGGSWR